MAHGVMANATNSRMVARRSMIIASFVLKFQIPVQLPELDCPVRQNLEGCVAEFAHSLVIGIPLAVALLSIRFAEC